MRASKVRSIGPVRLARFSKIPLSRQWAIGLLTATYPHSLNWGVPTAIILGFEFRNLVIAFLHFKAHACPVPTNLSQLQTYSGS